jgi:hypothetical protein
MADAYARLMADFSQMTSWGRGLESDLSRARVELMLAKAEVERLTKAGDVFSYAMDSLAVFANEEARLMARTASLAFKDARNAAKEGKPQP